MKTRALLTRAIRVVLTLAALSNDLSQTRCHAISFPDRCVYPMTQSVSQPEKKYSVNLILNQPASLLTE